MSSSVPVRVAVLVFDRFTALDAVGPFEVLARAPGIEAFFVAREAGLIRSAPPASLALQVDLSFESCPRPAIVIVSGGPGAAHAARDERTLEWLRDCHVSSRFTASVCTGARVLGAAGLLRGVRATTHWLARAALADDGAAVAEERVVVDGRIVTAAGVSAGIDMALVLVRMLVGDEAAQAIQLALEYDPQPPFDVGSPTKAPSALVERVRRLARSAPR